jgi:xanthine/uracil/vitamin C permease (AzgA family)
MTNGTARRFRITAMTLLVLRIVTLATLVSCAVALGQPPDAYQIGNASNLSTADAFVNVTNAATSNICVNAYVYSESQQMIECRSGLIAPNQAYFQSVRKNLRNIPDPSGTRFRVC